MAEKILVSASVGVMNSLLGKLATLMGEKYAKLKDVRKQVAFLHEELSSMAALLEDLADMEDLDNQTMQWRNKVREMSYDIEDCIDEFMHRVGGSCDGKGLLRRLKTLRARHQLANQIQELKIRVQEASARRMRYKLDDCKTRSGGVAVDPRISALYVESGYQFVGKAGWHPIVDNASVQELRVVSIVGFGGLGKTTLANEVYNKLGKSFACKAFVSVSQRPDMVVLLKSLVTQILGRGTDICEVNGLIDNLRKYLQDKRYLVVVDDLWDASAWEIIKCAFPEGHYGSKVLTTTRIKRVAVTCCNFQWEFVYRMKHLDDHSSRQLFYGRVFGLENTCPHPFEEPSEKILQKCGGLPLAIISIASLLASQSNRSVSQWNCVLNSLRSDLRSNPTLEGMRQILNLSYTHLPHHLRTCLLYIGSYFNELVNRSMIIQVVEYRALNTERIYHKVHDMVLDLIVTKSAEENFLCVVKNIKTITSRQHCKTPRLSLQLGESKLDKIAPRMSLTHVRSLCIFGSHRRSIELLELKFIRVLFVCEVFGMDLTPIGKLFHLRYLNVQSKCLISGMEMQLPKQICGLHHLETLVINGWLSQLPHDIVHLPALSYLKVSARKAYPDGISKMKSLHTLDGFDVSMQSVNNLRALGELLNLRKLYMRLISGNLLTMETQMDALFYSIQKLLNGNLRHFTVSTCLTTSPGSFYDWWNSLCFSDCRLEQLHLQYQFPRLPMWVGQLSTLSSLQIDVAELCKDDISVLAGLPALARLVLWAGYVPDEGIVFSSSAAFRSLYYFESRLDCVCVK
uniref:Uncharacterized protein n=1 Tax=Setaria italica TaxID=4555 RepID=K3YLF0_SETIT